MNDEKRHAALKAWFLANPDVQEQPCIIDDDSIVEEQPCLIPIKNNTSFLDRVKQSFLSLLQTLHD
uniref:Uncharacterized protein n=1 Tax=viral metagenome TaxID=1070528 RepID=A0A6C0JUA6_9ZZZZ